MSKTFQDHLSNLLRNIDEEEMKVIKKEYEKYGVSEYMGRLRSTKIKNSIINNMTEDEKHLYELRQIVSECYRMCNFSCINFNIV